MVITGPNGLSNILGAPDKQGKLAVLGGDHGEVTEIARGMANGRVSFGFMSGQQILTILGDQGMLITKKQTGNGLQNL